MCHWMESVFHHFCLKWGVYLFYQFWFEKGVWILQTTVTQIRNGSQSFISSLRQDHNFKGKGIELVNFGSEMGCLGGILVHSSVG